MNDSEPKAHAGEFEGEDMDDNADETWRKEIEDLLDYGDDEDAKET